MQHQTEQRIAQRYQPVPTLSERARSAAAAETERARSAAAATERARSTAAAAALAPELPAQPEVAIGNNNEDSEVMFNDGGGGFDTDEGPPPNADDNAMFSSFVPPVVLRGPHGEPLMKELIEGDNVKLENVPFSNLSNLAPEYAALFDERDYGFVIDEDSDEESPPPEDFNEEEWERYNDACPAQKDWKTHHKCRPESIPPFYVALLDLLKILGNHQVDLKLFDSVVMWVLHHTKRQSDVFTNVDDYTARTRSVFIKLVAKIFHTEHLLPTMKTAELVSGEKVDVPCYDMADMIVSLVTDEELMHPDNLIKEGMDHETWRPTCSMEDWSDDDIIDDVNSGTSFHEGHAMFNSDINETTEDVDEVRVLGLNLFIDKSHSDLHGALATTPMSCVPNIFNNEARRKYEFWRTFAYIPNLDVGHGTKKGYDPQRAKDIAAGRKVGPKPKTSIVKLKNQQILYRTAFESLKKIVKNKGVYTVIKGKRVCIKVYIAMIICDTVGANEFCCHYNSCGNAKVSCICKDCMCGFDDLIAIPPNCVHITRAHAISALDDPDAAVSVSQHPVASAFNELPLADKICGINGMCPFENLHVFGNGLYKDVVQVIHDLIGKKDTGATKKGELDYVFRLIATELQRCSERDVPRFTVRFGALDMSRLTGSERMGTVLILAIALSCDWGRTIMKKYLDAKGLSFVGVLNAVTMLLAYDRWTQDRNITRSDLDYAEPAVCELMENVLRFLPKPRIEKQKRVIPKKKKAVSKKKKKRKQQKPAGSSKREPRRETRAPMVGTKLSSTHFGR